MSKTQLIVLWVGIGIIVIMGLFPPVKSGIRGGYEFILDARSVILSRLIIEWVLVVVITGGLIYSLKVDSDLMLKMPCLLLSLLRKRSYKEILEDAKNNKDKANVFYFWFWVVVLVLLFFILIAIHTTPPTRYRVLL